MAKLKTVKRSIGKAGLQWEDIAQQAFVESMTKAFGRDYFNKYLHKAMVHIAINSLRRTNQDKVLVSNLKQLVPLVNLESLDLIVDVHRVFETAGYHPNEVHACFLFYCANFSLREIVAIYGQSHTHWRRFFNRTRTLFRKELSDYKFIPSHSSTDKGGK